MLARVQSFVLQGIDALPCEVEVDFDAADFADTNTRTTTVGLPDTAVKESIERVRSALANSSYPPQKGHTLINLAPADIRKEGPLYDLPIALGLLIAQGVLSNSGGGTNARGGPSHDPSIVIRAARQRHQLPTAAPTASPKPFDPFAEPDPAAPALIEDAATASEPLDPRHYLFAGELALDGRLRPVRGVIAMAALAKSRGLRGVVVPADNAAEAAVVPGVEAIGVASLTEIIGLIRGDLDARPHPPADIAALLATSAAPVDFVDVRGQEAVKRAIVVAAAGSHNLIMLGPAGTGKTMMARALPGVLPPLTPEEAVEITRIYSAAGMLPPGAGLITLRPVRTPHHTASSAAIVGGGAIPRPGEISLAHRGVLFMDELPEFPREVLETLRQPLEDHVVTIARSHSAVRFPASFMLVAAMNPTQKGDMPSDEYGKKQMDRYLAKLSGPLIDRIDIHVEAPAVPWKQLSSAPRGTSSADMRAQVLAARERQNKRQGPMTPNSRLTGRQLDQFAPLSEDARTMLGQAMTELGLSARAYDKIRRVSRTIADLKASEEVTAEHVAEAVQYRLLDRKI
jgi:magnesium chelatase family protein